MHSLRKIFGILILALRAALRTKTVFALLLLIASCVLLLPVVIKGDGSPQGDCQILLLYTLGFSFGILCLSTLWAACALFAAEIDNQLIQLSIVKPVRAIEFWLGKWLALLVLNALILTAVYGVVYLQLKGKQRQPGWRENVQLVSRSVVHPLLPTPEEEARAAYAELEQKKALPRELSKAQILRVLISKAHERYTVVNPGESVAWRFPLHRPVTAMEPITVRIRFDTELSTRTHVMGVCELSSGIPQAKTLQVPLDDLSQNEIEFDLAGNAFGVTNTITSLNLRFTHTGDPAKSAALMLRFRQDVVILTPGGSFEANLFRSALVHWSVLALLAAFGLTLSACFSLPVAVFTSTILVLLVMIGTSVTATVSVEDENEWLKRPGIIVSRGVSTVAHHALRLDPLDALVKGERIEKQALGEALLWNSLLTPACFALLGILILKRREWASGD
jgi:hypothetical protein